MSFVAAPPLSKEGYEHIRTVLRNPEHNPSQTSRTIQKFTSNPLIQTDFGTMPVTLKTESEPELEWLINRSVSGAEQCYELHNNLPALAHRHPPAVIPLHPTQLVEMTLDWLP